MHFQIQNQQDLDFVNMWVHCCLILHNMIIEVEEDLSVHSSNDEFMQEAATWGVPLVNEGDDQGEDVLDRPVRYFSLAIDRSCSCTNICCFSSCSCWAWLSRDLSSFATIWALILIHLVLVLALVVSWIWQTIVSDASEILMVTSKLTFLDRLRDAEELGAEAGGEGT